MIAKSSTRTPVVLPLKSQTRSRHIPDRSATHDAVQVFCRIRPMQSEADLSCFRVISPTTVALTPADKAVNLRNAPQKETQFMFKHVLDVNSTQHKCYAVVAQPLVENMLKGKNGLLFTYGVTGSGKTFTMTGNSNDQGIMPRCLDALFKTIADYQTKKFVFKPDRLNGFEILSESDALLERQADVLARYSRQDPTSSKYSDDSDIASRASCDEKLVGCINEDNMYAIFISYIEIYNNSVFDLLEDTVPLTIQPRNTPLSNNNAGAPQSKIIREDSNKTMFVHGVTEIEVKTLQEAMDVFQTGQKRKRIGHTLLNAESSRSHSVFTIRLVQAPIDNQSDHVMHDKLAITVSQLSLVDLAGSERSSRTKNTGARLREAGNINNSLMTLRTCLEVLRANQTSTPGVQRKVPYRDSKITHLFKSYFDGEGVVRMIVCINPRAEDYDESIQVMKFAEMTQDVQIARPTPMKYDVALTPRHRKELAHTVNNFDDIVMTNARFPAMNLVYNLGPCLPDYSLHTPEPHEMDHLIQCLEQRIQKRKTLKDDYNSRQKHFRMSLIQMERDNLKLRTENASLKAAYNQERLRTQSHEAKIGTHENSIDHLNNKLKMRDNEIRNLQTLLNQKQLLINQKDSEREIQHKRSKNHVAEEREKIEVELENKLPPPKKHHKGVPVSNIRHRRSRSTGDRWLEHRAQKPVPLGTILQPYLPNRKSVTKLTSVRDITNTKTTKYCLVSQAADTDGELETRLFKGDVIPTTSGGAQVVFDDVECLKQSSPVTGMSHAQRGRSSNPSHMPPNNHYKSCQTEYCNCQCKMSPMNAEDVASKCIIAIEGHSNKNKHKY